MAMLAKENKYSIKDKYRVIAIARNRAKPWILEKHYAKRMPPISFVFGLFCGKELKGICAFGNALAPGVSNTFGNDYTSFIYELVRLCIDDDCDRNVGSFFVSKSLLLLGGPKIVISFADSNVGHVGYIYQATNWIYTGLGSGSV